jgi:S1-C subfamily serine protease
MKTKLVLLLALVVIFSVATKAQTAENVTFKVAVVDKALNLKNVPKFALVVRRSSDPAFAARKVSTSFDGTAKLSLPAGEYVAVSEVPVVFEDRSFAWEHKFKVEQDKSVTVELSNDNAKIASAAAQSTRRRGSEVGELFKTLRNGVVTIEGELGSGTGFIFDEKGLVLTNQHVISDTMEIRVRFNKDTAVRARLIAKDIDRDLAVLQINLGAFADSKVLKLAANNPAEPSVFEGEQVFTIGSPANQEKILSTGTVSKIEARSIISDINFSPGNSGGPLFNSIGEVVGITTFEVKEKNKTDSGLAGIVRIEETAALIAKAREIVATKGTPSAELMPNIPEGIFPVETIKTAVLSKEFSSKQYLSDVKDYQIKFMTPVYKFYAIEKDRIESLKIRDKRNKSKGMLHEDMFRDLRIWKEYAGELMPAVDILALPETSPTGKSMALSAITNLTIGYSTPLAHKYKADFAQMKLMCDGKEVTPLRRSKTEIIRDLQNYYKTQKRYTYAGVYTYPYDVFGPGRCSQMELHVFSEEDIEKPIVTQVTEAIKNRVWLDFSDFRTQIASTRTQNREQ